MMVETENLSKSKQKLLGKLGKVNEAIHVTNLLVEYFQKALDKKQSNPLEKSCSIDIS
jgi:hypothetical protein